SAPPPCPPFPSRRRFHISSHRTTSYANFVSFSAHGSINFVNFSDAPRLRNPTRPRKFARASSFHRSCSVVSHCPNDQTGIICVQISDAPHRFILQLPARPAAETASPAAHRATARAHYNRATALRPVRERPLRPTPAAVPARH